MPGLAAAAGLSNTEVTRRCCCCSACYDGEANFQTSWFVITLLTELGVLQVLRTLRPAFRSRPGQLLLWTALGVTVFAFLGHIAAERGCSLGAVVDGGSSLAFEVFPVAFGALPFPHLWAVAFFLMLLNLGVSSAVSMTSPLATSITEALCRPAAGTRDAAHLDHARHGKRPPRAPAAWARRRASPAACCT